MAPSDLFPAPPTYPFDAEEREVYCSKCGERIKPDPKKSGDSK